MHETARVASAPLTHLSGAQRLTRPPNRRRQETGHPVDGPHFLGSIFRQDGTCRQEAIESLVDRRYLLLFVLLATWGITGVGVWSLLARLMGHPVSLPKFALDILLTGTASLLLTWVLLLAAGLSLAKGLRYRWPGSPPADLLLDAELYGSLVLVSVPAGGSLLLAWAWGFSYGEAVGWLILLLVTGLLMSALAKRMIPRWRRSRGDGDQGRGGRQRSSS